MTKRSSKWGGISYLIGLTSNSNVLVGAKTFAEQIRDLARLRRFVDLSYDLGERASDTSEAIDPKAIAAMVEEGIIQIMDEPGAMQSARLGDAIDETLEEIEAERRGEGTPGIKLANFQTWNDLLGDMPGGDVTVLAGRPGMGKSGVALHVGLRAAQDGYGVLLPQLEMSKRQMVKRALADMLWSADGAPTADQVAHGNLTENERARQRELILQMRKWPLVMEECPGLTPIRLAAMIRRHGRAMEARGQKLRLVVVDYLQLMMANRPTGNANTDVSAISKAIKIMAKEYDVHILLLSQLSRAVEQREDKRPQLSDLRDSGSIEQDADNVVFAYRDDYYLSAQTEPRDMAASSDWRHELEQCRDELDLICRKRRHGSPSTRRCRFYLRHQAIRDEPTPQEGAW